MKRPRLVALVALVAACLTLAVPARLVASPSQTLCQPPGEVVVTDPEGDGPSAETDILDIAFAELFSGPHAGRIMVTLRVVELGESPAGHWIVQWQDPSGQRTTSLSVNICGETVNASYSYDAPEGNASGQPDAFTHTPEGTIEFIVSRDKIGDPGDGDMFVSITGLAIPWQAGPLGCLPQLATDATGPGSYMLGGCVLDASRPDLSAGLSLGPAFPNPGRSSVAFTLDVPVGLIGRRLDAGIFDVAGRRLCTVASAPAADGRIVLRWDLRDAAGAPLPTGTYWMRVRLDGEVRTRAFQVMR